MNKILSCGLMVILLSLCLQRVGISQEKITLEHWDMAQAAVEQLRARETALQRFEKKIP